MSKVTDDKKRQQQSNYLRLKLIDLGMTHKQIGYICEGSGKGMIVNKRALYALAQYYDAFVNANFVNDKDRNLLIEYFIPCIQESFDMKIIVRSFRHMQMFFNNSTQEGVYDDHITDREVSKLLRYIAKHSKFPPLKRLHYV